MLFSTIIVIFYSCEKDEDTFYCETLENISGTWKKDARTITFTKKYEFIDSVFHDQYNESLAEVVNGRFELINGFIELSDLKFTYLSDMSGINYLSFLFPTFRYEIIDNKLYFDGVGIYSPVGHSGVEINGKWKSNRLIVVYDTEQSPSFLSGSQEIEYEFNKEASNFLVNSHNTYGIFEEKLTDGPFIYQFENPFIYVNESKYLIGEIKDNILIIYSDGERVFTKAK
jgi:hypothetical protein